MDAKLRGFFWGRSRTMYLYPRTVQSSVHSYRSATLKELFKLISQYTSQKLKSFLITAGFNDNRSNPQDFAIDWQCHLDIIYMFNSSTVIVPKTILSFNQPHTNKKLNAVNSALLFLLFNFYPCVITLSFDKIYEFTFFRDVHFSYYGNQSFASSLESYFCSLLRSVSSPAMSHDYGCETLLKRFHDQTECSHCKTLLQNASICCNDCGWLHVGCSGMKRSADRLLGFECPRCLSKATQADRSVPITALPTDLYTKNKVDTNSLPPREAQVADDANDGAIVAAAPQNVAEKRKIFTKRSCIHCQETPIRSKEIIERSVTGRQTS